MPSDPARSRMSSPGPRRQARPAVRPRPSGDRRSGACSRTGRSDKAPSAANAAIDLRRDQGSPVEVEPGNPPPPCASHRISASRWAAMMLSSPAPAVAKVKVAGTMPIRVASAKVRRRTPNRAAARFVSQNGITGRSAQEQEVGEGVLPEALRETLEPRAGPRQEEVAERGPGDQEDQDGAGASPRATASAPPRSQPNRKPPRIVRNTAPGNGEGDGRRRRRGRRARIACPRCASTKAWRVSRCSSILLDREIAVQAGGEDGGGREREAAPRARSAAPMRLGLLAPSCSFTPALPGPAEAHA